MIAANGVRSKAPSRGITARIGANIGSVTVIRNSTAGLRRSTLGNHESRDLMMMAIVRTRMVALMIAISSGFPFAQSPRL